ncbi:MAG: hypothetical protein Kow00121_42470 [Elainellaceae cyanobacterium]
MEMQVPHIVSTIHKKFEVEGLTNTFFKIKSHSFVDTHHQLCLDTENCILLEFSTPAEEFPEIYDSPVYRLLIIFNLYQETEFNSALQYALGRLRYKDNIDRIALWSTAEIDPNTIQLLKDSKIDIIFLETPTKKDIQVTKSVHHFIPIEGTSLAQSLTVNLIAEHLIKRLRKMFHLVLSEIAAPIYKSYYSHSKISTREFMKFEEEKLNQLIKKLKSEGRNQTAIDVGCGTGRHSFPLARHFETVFAYDFSPNMIDEANKIRKENDIRNVFFLVNDFEYERLLDEEQFYGRCDLVLASFGMGSYVEDTSTMLRRFYDWLKPGGYVFLSFYNGESITFNLTSSWRESSLAAQIDRDNNSLEVHLTPKTRFKIFCKVFDTGVEGEINRIFNIDAILSFPMIMSILPNSFLENESARSSLSDADRVLAESKEGQSGYYTIVIAHKTDQATNGYANAKNILDSQQADYEIIEHRPVLSIEDVQKQLEREIKSSPYCIIKTILINIRKTDEFIAILLQADKRLDTDKIAQLLGVNRYHINFAREKELLRIGFPLGGIAPFGFEPDLNIRKFADRTIAARRCKWFYTGIGDNRKTLKIKRQDFLKVIADYEQIDI